jgi:hypothetical protein
MRLRVAKDGKAPDSELEKVSRALTASRLFSFRSGDI